MKELQKQIVGMVYALDHVDGMRKCLELIADLRRIYTQMGYKDNDLSIERVLCDVENVIGTRAYQDWKMKQ